MALVVTEAVVLHTFDYLESSRIVRLATRELGVQSVLARGARRPRSRFGSSLDLFASGTAHFYLKPGRDLSTLGGFDVTRARLGIAARRGTALDEAEAAVERLGASGRADLIRMPEIGVSSTQIRRRDRGLTATALPRPSRSV